MRKRRHIGDDARPQKHPDESRKSFPRLIHKIQGPNWLS